MTGDKGRGFTRGNMNREGFHEEGRMFSPGDRPGHAGEFQECDSQGNLLDQEHRIQLDSDDESLPDTWHKNNLWKMMN
ncbi:hypothetical protein C7446_1168 [Kushneria sinocarnis]|uniref:Uncharacterized protein n=1 Tax=Kushneria sinocarnis TaxID=595502 RepID=A0A420WYJ3_9GAMM|nr:hypothetical protein [Kushneria sinocarnis]RKR06230.1 hypothetical protein C7446_1168 [Kushneria sinocarnis]